MERKRVLWAAALLLLAGAALFARRWLSPAAQGLPQNVVYSAGGPRMSSVLRRIAALLGHDSPLTVGDLRALLSSASDDPEARRFAEEFMRDPALGKVWEAHRDEDPAKVLLKEVAEAPEFAELADRWQENARFLTAAERFAKDLEDDVADGSASSDRMLLTAAGAPAGAASLPRSAASLAAPGPTAGHGYDLARFKSLFAMMAPEPRKRVLAELEEGRPIGDACARAGASQACDDALKRCRADPDCERRLDGSAVPGGKDRTGVIVRQGEEPPPGDGEAPTGPEPPQPPSRPRRSGGGGGEDDGGGGKDKPTYRAQIKEKQSSPAGSKARYTEGPRCFLAGTRVLTPAGEVPIETIRPGDTVLSADLRSGEVVATSVVRTFKAEAKGLRRLTLSNGLELRVTEEHPFFDPETGRFRRVREISAGDLVARLARAGSLLPAPPAPFSAAGRRPLATLDSGPPAAGLLEAVTVVGIEELASEGVAVYNFHVDAQHNYFAEGVLVHNRKVE